MRKNIAISRLDFIFIPDRQIVRINGFESPGFIPNINSGGEESVRKLKGGQVIANDAQRDKQEKAADSPLKVVLHSRELQFPELRGPQDSLMALFNRVYPALEFQDTCIHCRL
ncbi:MAG: hypothetical protein JSV44_01245 [Candidatus Zixiibacteriota bacterium]|nr:MAG: hypothetical protein JSV44_01245 [candidate division Zixibacteria bacterium]